MNEIEIFTNPAFGEVRTLTIDSKPYFVGKDVAEILGYSNVNKAIQRHVDDEDKKTLDYKGFSHFGTTLWGSNDFSNKTIITESGLYSLILSSKLPTAKKFKHWVTADILPTIRQHGAYMTKDVLEKALTSPDFLMQLAQQLKDEREKRAALETTVAVQDQQIKELKPKADYTDSILRNKGLVTITQIAKDYGMSGNKLNSMLHEYGVQYLLSGQWLLYSQYQGKGYTHSETVDITHSDGRKDIKMITKWTQKGRLFIYARLKKHGILPMIERG